MAEIDGNGLIGEAQTREVMTGLDGQVVVGATEPPIVSSRG